MLTALRFTVLVHQHMLMMTSHRKYLGASTSKAGWFAVVYVGTANKNKKKTYKDNSSSCFDNLQHYNNLT